MLLTLYYMATTWLQSYRLSNVKSNLKRFLSNNLTIVLYKEKDFVDLENESLCAKENSDIFLSLRPHGFTSDSCKNARTAQLDQIIAFIGHKRSCSVLPEQILNVDSWITIPSNQATFPALLNARTPLNLKLESKLHLLIEANYKMFNVNKNIDKCLIEDFGVPKAWSAGENFGILLETDLDHFTMLASNFMADSKPLYLGSHMELLRIQTVKVEGQPCDIINHESIASNIDFVYNLQNNYGINCNLTSVQWKNYCDTLNAVSVAAEKVLQSGKPISFCSAVLSRDTENDLDMNDHVVIENLPDEIDCTNVKTVQLDNISDKIDLPYMKTIPDKTEFTNVKSVQSENVPDEIVLTNVKSIHSENVPVKTVFTNVKSVQSEILPDEINLTNVKPVQSKSIQDEIVSTNVKSVHSENVPVKTVFTNVKSVQSEILPDEINLTNVKPVQSKSIQDEINLTNVKSVQSENIQDKIVSTNVKSVQSENIPDEINLTNVKSVQSENIQDEIVSTIMKSVQSENVHEIDLTNVKTVQSDNFGEKNGKNINTIFESPKETSLHYVQFNNGTNGQSNDDNYYSENSSISSSSDSISFQKIAFTPMEENEVKSSNRMKPIKSSPDFFGIYSNSLNASMIRNHRSFSDFANALESKTRCHTPVHHMGEVKTGKPPNIIIFSDSASSSQQIQNSLESVLHRYRYTIYSLSLEKMLQSPWTTQATMVVICGAIPDELYPLLEHYLLIEGGRILCLCSDFLGSLLPTAFSTAEVCSDEIVSFTYYPLSMRTSLLHHVFCYQPSMPSNDGFPSENGIKEEVNSLDIVDVFDINNKHHAIKINVLAAEDTWETPSLILATAPSGGKVIFSQVHLEIDPHLNGEVHSSQEDRYLLIKDLLSTYLDLDCKSCAEEPKHTPAYLLGTENDKVEFLSSLNGKVSKNNILLLKDLKVQFCTKDEMCIGPSEYSLPVICNDFPAIFNEEVYLKNLHTKDLGRLLIVGEVMSSSMKLLNEPILRHGLVIIPKQQVTGIGRGGNKWLSPAGCAMFSVQLHIPFESKLGQRLALLQHVVALSVVSAICSLPGGYDKLDLGLKWPNDIYAGGNAKIGGLVISSSAMGNMAICSIGCGVNLSNSLPTTCINDIIVEHNTNTHNNLKTLSFEEYFGAIFTELERLINQVQNGNVDVIFDLYYKYWLHGNTEVTVLRPDKSSFKATIIGLDDHGFLKVRSEDGDIVDVRPDGNSFDMLAGLIAPK